MSVGTACVSDMFFLHERGEKTGIYTIFVTNGAHIAAICKFLQLQLPRIAIKLKYSTFRRRLPVTVCQLEMGLLVAIHYYCVLPARSNICLSRNPLLEGPCLPPREDQGEELLEYAL